MGYAFRLRWGLSSLWRCRRLKRAALNPFHLPLGTPAGAQNLSSAPGPATLARLTLPASALDNRTIITPPPADNDAHYQQGLLA